MDKEKKEEILREAHERAKAAVTRKEKSILRTVGGANSSCLV